MKEATIKEWRKPENFAARNIARKIDDLISEASKAQGDTEPLANELENLFMRMYYVLEDMKRDLVLEHGQRAVKINFPALLSTIEDVSAE